MTDCVIDVALLATGSFSANSINPSCFTNPAATVSANTFWTPLSTKYLEANSQNNYVVNSSPEGNMRDVELTTWTRQGYVYLKLDVNGKAVYFFHNGNTANGTLEIGIVTGLNQSSYPGGTYYKLYSNTNLVGSVSGYNKTNTTGAYFTFGVSGVDVYVGFNGTEFCRFKDYFHLGVAGVVALKAATGNGFRAITLHPLSASIFSTSTVLDMRDFNMRAIQTTGSASAGSSSLVVASAAGFQVGDWVIVEIGHEVGAGARGTIGVGGQWPALTYANTTVMNADTSQPVNTFGWTQSDGLVRRWTGSSWTTSFQNYYTAKAIPWSLHGRITNIAGTTLTLDTAATAATTNANVYLDNQPYINYITAQQHDAIGVFQSLLPITPVGLTVVFPAGAYAGSGRILVQAKDHWIFRGAGQAQTTLVAPDGVYPLSFYLNEYIPSSTYDGHTLFDFTLQSNWGLDKYGLSVMGWTKVPGSLTVAGLTVDQNDVNDSSVITQTNMPQGLMYVPGLLASACSDVTFQDITVDDVSQKAFAADFSNNVWAYRCTNNQNSILQVYVQWQFQWSNTTGGGCVDCKVDSVALVPGFESFKAVDHQMIRPVSVNAEFSQNNSQGWLIQDASITITPASSLPPDSSPSTPLVNINTNFGDDNVASGGTIKNININVLGYIDSNNDVPIGIIVNASNPNVTINGGSYVAPDYAAPSTTPGPMGIVSTGPNTSVNCFRSTGVIAAVPPPDSNHANIGIADGSVTNSVALIIVAPTQSGNAAAGPLPAICNAVPVPRRHPKYNLVIA